MPSLQAVHQSSSARNFPGENLLAPPTAPPGGRTGIPLPTRPSSSSTPTEALPGPGQRTPAPPSYGACPHFLQGREFGGLSFCRLCPRGASWLHPAVLTPTVCVFLSLWDTEVPRSRGCPDPLWPAAPAQPPATESTAHSGARAGGRVPGGGLAELWLPHVLPKQPRRRHFREEQGVATRASSAAYEN